MATSAELTNTFGVLLIGFIFSVVLYGLTFFRTFAPSRQRQSSRSLVTCAETYIYYTRFPQDVFATKWTVNIFVSVMKRRSHSLRSGWAHMVRASAFVLVHVFIPPWLGLWTLLSQL